MKTREGREDRKERGDEEFSIDRADKFLSSEIIFYYLLFCCGCENSLKQYPHHRIYISSGHIVPISRQVRAGVFLPSFFNPSPIEPKDASSPVMHLNFPLSDLN